jgi:hypothetical protein
MDLGTILIPAAIFGGAALLTSLRILYEYERGVIFRLGKLTRAKGPGLIFLVPFGVERMRKMDLRVVALDIAPQDTITKDNVSVTVNAVVYFRVADPAKAVVEVEDYYFATSQLAQTTLRSVIGQSELDELLAERERINEVVRRIIDQGTDPWGIDVTAVEIKDIDLPQEMKRAMAKQAEAERQGHFSSPGRPAAALPADRGGDRGREQLHHAVPDPHRSVQTDHREGDRRGGRGNPRHPGRAAVSGAACPAQRRGGAAPGRFRSAAARSGRRRGLGRAGGGRRE